VPAGSLGHRGGVGTGATGEVLYRWGMRASRPSRLLASLLVILVALLAAPAGVAAQSSSPAGSAAPVVLEPISDAGYAISSVAPVGWAVVGPGIRARQATTGDPTILAQQAAPVPIDSLWPSLLPQLGLTSVPESVGTRTSAAGLDWQLYRVPVGGNVADLALASDAGTSYIVLLVSMPSERDALVDAVLLPAVDALAPLEVTRTPLPSGIGYTERDVAFPGGAADVTLAGTLTVPDGEGTHPAVVLMTGSGAQDRDEALAGMTLKPFALLADALGRAGIAVLRYDDRGTAASTGDYASATIADFTADGQAALDWLRQQPDVDADRVGVLGHSEGGAYIASIAANDPDVAFVVGLAPMVRPGLELLVDQTYAIARSQGLTEEEAQTTADANRRIYDAALADDPAELEAVLREVAGQGYDSLDPAEQQQAGDREAFIEQLVRTQLPTLTTPWFRSLLAADPSRDWATVDAPVLGLFGGKDVQVIAGPESAALTAALGGRDARSRVETIVDANHLFQTAVTGATTEYPTLDQTFTPELLPLLTAWVREVTGLDG